jgi:hypothetical protein
MILKIENNNLPFMVDLVEYQTGEDAFKKIIDHEGIKVTEYLP